MEVLASNTHVFNSGAEFITHFLNFPARANGHRTLRSEENISKNV